MGGLGFRDLEIFNMALLARQAWRLLQDPLSPSAKILKAVYFPSVSLFEAELGTHPSQVWRAILDGGDVLAHGVVRGTDDGRTTKIWDQNWIQRDMVMKPITSLVADPSVQVTDLIDDTSASWREDRLKEVFDGSRNYDYLQGVFI